MYEQRAQDFKYPYAFDAPLETWVELVVANALYDRAGFVLLSDVFKHTIYGLWMCKINKQPGGHEKLQRAADWMYSLTFNLFYLLNSHKKHNIQIDCGVKGYTNDKL